jgi:hypothetical protein
MMVMGGGGRGGVVWERGRERERWEGEVGRVVWVARGQSSGVVERMRVEWGCMESDVMIRHHN